MRTTRVAGIAFFIPVLVPKVKQETGSRSLVWSVVAFWDLELAECKFKCTVTRHYELLVLHVHAYVAKGIFLRIVSLKKVAPLCGK